MIEVQNLVKRFGQYFAVNDINFKIGKGDIVGLLGPNGAGKTTTMRMLTGYYNPTSGTVSVFGKKLVNDESRLEIQRKVGYLPESAASYPDMLVKDYLRFIAEARGIVSNKLNDAIDQSSEATQLENYWYRPISQLSKGYRQRVALAATLLHDPDILILDEPTSGLDPNQITEIQNLIKELAQEKTIILSTHILSEIEYTCERAIIIAQGTVVFDDSLENLAAMKQGRGRIFVKAEQDTNIIQPILEESFGQTEIIQGNVVLLGDDSLPSKIFQLAVNKGWTLTNLTTEKTSLETIFRKLTEGDSQVTDHQKEQINVK